MILRKTYEAFKDKLGSKYKAAALTILYTPMMLFLYNLQRAQNRKKQRIKQEERIRMEARKELEQEADTE